VHDARPWEVRGVCRLNERRALHPRLPAGSVAPMPIPTEPIGSIPRPPELMAAVTEFAAGKISREQLRARSEQAIRETVRRFEATGSPVITDGEQAKPSFAPYHTDGHEQLSPVTTHD